MGPAIFPFQLSHMENLIRDGEYATELRNGSAIKMSMSKISSEVYKNVKQRYCISIRTRGSTIK